MVTVFFALMLVMGEATSPSYINYTTVTGYFLQDDPSTNASDFDNVRYVSSSCVSGADSCLQTAVNFGLINRTYDTDAQYDPKGEKTQWQRFAHKVWSLNRASGKNLQYKVLYMGRHGDGYHNVAEEFYRTPAWNVGAPKIPAMSEH